MCSSDDFPGSSWNIIGIILRNNSTSSHKIIIAFQNKTSPRKLLWTGFASTSVSQLSEVSFSTFLSTASWKIFFALKLPPSASSVGIGSGSRVGAWAWNCSALVSQTVSEGSALVTTSGAISANVATSATTSTAWGLKVLITFDCQYKALTVYRD